MHYFQNSYQFKSLMINSYYLLQKPQPELCDPQDKEPSTMILPDLQEHFLAIQKTLGDLHKFFELLA